MLEEALIQMVVGGTEYGQKGIADTIEILRKMRCEIGAEDLKEWVQRVFVLVQQEEILLGEVCTEFEDIEDSNERVLVEGDGSEVIGKDGLCDLRCNGEAGDTPQRQKPNEQLAGELDLLMQKLPHEAAQKAVIMYCLRIACEGEGSMPQTLSTAQEGQTESYTMKIRSGCDVDANGKAAGKGALIQTEKSGTLSCVQDQYLFQPVAYQDAVGSLCARDFKGVGSQYVDEGKLVVERVPASVCYSLDPLSSNSMKSANPHSGCHETDVARTIDTTYPDPSKNQGGVAVVAAVDCRNGTEDDTNGALQSMASNNINSNNVVRTRYTVRRLTPLECERLQGYPDGWTDIGEYIDSNGKKKQSSDAARYKALGNSIAIPPWKWVMKRLCACYERDATLASLFDGISGFPFIWTQLNGWGSVLWSSEIDEFPMAVCKKHFGDEATGERGDFYEAIL